VEDRISALKDKIDFNNNKKEPRAAKGIHKNSVTL
jgi:hypothetical protein